MIPDEAVESAAKAVFVLIAEEPWEPAHPGEQDKAREFARVALEAAVPLLLTGPSTSIKDAVARVDASLSAAPEAARGLTPTLKTEWGVRYDTHVDWIERPAAGEAWAKVIFKENQDEGAIAVVRRQVSEWEVVDRG